jgi:hypothetical protein
MRTVVQAELSVPLSLLVHVLGCAHVQVEIKTTPQTTNPDVLQKAADFVQAFILGKRWEAAINDKCAYLGLPCSMLCFVSVANSL